MSSNIVWDKGHIDRRTRFARLGKGATLWFTGLSGSGKSTIAAALEVALIEHNHRAYRLDGDNIRHGLNADLTFSANDRSENIRRIGEVARLFADSGCIALTSFISPFRSDRQRSRQMHLDAGLDFFEIFVDTPLAVCEQRDPKGLYAKARAGDIRDMTGIGSPYEEPRAPELVLQTPKQDVPMCVQACLDLLVGLDLIPRPLPKS